MPQFNTNAYRLTTARDALTGSNADAAYGSPSTGSVLQKASVNPPTLTVPGRPLQSNPLGRALAGSRVRGGASGGSFAPRIVSGTR